MSPRGLLGPTLITPLCAWPWSAAGPGGRLYGSLCKWPNHYHFQLLQHLERLENVQCRRGGQREVQGDARNCSHISSRSPELGKKRTLNPARVETSKKEDKLILISCLKKFLFLSITRLIGVQVEEIPAVVLVLLLRALQLAQVVRDLLPGDGDARRDLHRRDGIAVRPYFLQTHCIV